MILYIFSLSCHRKSVILQQITNNSNKIANNINYGSKTAK